MGVHTRARKAPPPDPFTLPLEFRMRRLAERMTEIEKHAIEIQRAIPTADTLRPVLLDIYAEECGRLEALRDDAVRILTLLVEKGLVSQEELNAAIAREPR